MINRRKILLQLTFLISSIFLIHLGAMKFYWYQSMWYFDILMHFLGGMVAMFLSLYLLYSRIFKKSLSSKIIIGIISVLIIGIGWEVFEYIFNNIIAGIEFDLLDTLSDVFFDTLGAIAGSFLCYNKTT